MPAINGGAIIDHEAPREQWFVAVESRPPQFSSRKDYKLIVFYGTPGRCFPGPQRERRKRLSGRTRKGDRYLRRILVQSAWSVIHKKDCFLTALFHRIATRRGMKKAAMAVGHRILIICWKIIRDGGVTAN